MGVWCCATSFLCRFEAQSCFQNGAWGVMRRLLGGSRHVALRARTGLLVPVDACSRDERVRRSLEREIEGFKVERSGTVRF